jgi:hypothetical protein
MLSGGVTAPTDSGDTSEGERTRIGEVLARTTVCVAFESRYARIA